LLRITVIDGKAVITAEDGTVTEIPEGYQSTICLTEPDNLGVDGQTNDQTVTYVCGGWTAPEEIPADFRERFGLVDDFPLNYLLDILTPTPVPPAPVVPTATFTPTPAPTETPWPVIPTDTPVPQNGLQIVADVQLAPAMGGFAGLPRFRGVGEGGYGWFFNLSLEVTNAGANPARNIVIGNVFPEDIGEPYVEELSGEFDYQTNTWTIDELAPGQTAALYGGSLVFLDCGGSISSQLTISAEASEPFPPVFSYSAIVDCRASVTVFVSAWLYPDGGALNVPAFAGVGAGSQLWSLDLFVEVTNFGPLDASNVVVGNIFPLEVTNIDGWTESGDFDPESNTWTIGDVWVNDYLSLSGDASVWLSCGGSVGSDITVTSDTPLYETLWSYSALADCVPATQWVEPPAADAPEATETPAPEVTDAPEATDSPEATDAPEATDSPEATVAPEPPPEASAEPEATAPPV
jgi:hypothetical protein